MPDFFNPTKGERLYNNITDDEIGYLPDDMCICKSCGEGCFDMTNDGYELCQVCFAEPRINEDENDR